MKINSLYIHAFGGLKNFSLDFTDALTVIYGENEQGKSTIMAFIQMIFYGSGRASAQLSKNIRKRYTPWDGSQMAGSIDFEHNGKKYRLEKEFRSSNSTDKATLCDLDIGTRQAVSGDIGSSFFGLSQQAFERSVFIGQFGYPESDASAEGEINSKLSNIALTGEENVSFEEVNTRLQKAKLALMSKSGKAGEYDKNLKLISETEARIQKGEEIQRSAVAKKTKITEAEKEIEYYGKKALSLKEKINHEQDVLNAEKLSRLLELKKQLTALNDTLKLRNGTVIDEVYLSNLKFCLSKVDGVNARINTKNSEIALLRKSLDAGLNPPNDASPDNAEKLKQEITVLKSKINNADLKKAELKNQILISEQKLIEAKNEKKKVNTPLLWTSIATMVAGLLLFIAFKNQSFAPLISITAIAVGLLILILSFVFRPENKSDISSAEEKLNSYKSELSNINLNINEIKGLLSIAKAKEEAISTALGSSTAIIENQQQLLKEKQCELMELNKEKKEEETRLLNEFSKYKPIETVDDLQSALDEITEKAASRKELKQQLNFILNDLNGISYEEAEKKLATINQNKISSNEDFEQLKSEYEQMRNHITELKTQIAANTAELRSMVSGMENIDKLRQDLSQLKEKTNSQKEFCIAAELASAILTESFGELRRSYGSALEKRAGEIFQMLTSSKYSSMSISKSLDIAVEQTDIFGSREIDYLSSGTCDQAYLSLRLAITELMCAENEPLPLFLDDALTQYDSKRMKTALEFLHEYAQNTQIIMFTCHSDIYEVAKELNAFCKKLGE